MPGPTFTEDHCGGFGARPYPDGITRTSHPAPQRDPSTRFDRSLTTHGASNTGSVPLHPFRLRLRARTVWFSIRLYVVETASGLAPDGAPACLQLQPVTAVTSGGLLLQLDPQRLVARTRVVDDERPIRFAEPVGDEGPQVRGSCRAPASRCGSSSAVLCPAGTTRLSSSRSWVSVIASGGFPLRRCRYRGRCHTVEGRPVGSRPRGPAAWPHSRPPER
jgi:hypothetical protein